MIVNKQDISFLWKVECGEGVFIVIRFSSVKL